MDTLSLHGQVATLKTQSQRYREKYRVMITEIQQVL